MITDINLNLYRIFFVCAKSKSFVEASKKLCVSQSAISKQIKVLETSLGTKLFYRTQKGLSLTKDGKQLFAYIDKAYNYLIAGEKIIIENNNMNVGTITIGAPAHIASFYLLEFIQNYRNKYPNVLFRIINGSTTELLLALEEHKVDFVVDSSPIHIKNNDIKTETLLSFETCFITSIENKKVKFDTQKYIMPYKQSSIRRNLEQELSKYGINLDVVLEVETTDLIISSVKNRIGSGYVVKKSVETELQKEELVELETPYVLPKLELKLVYIEDYLSNLSKHFIKKYIKNKV